MGFIGFPPFIVYPLSISECDEREDDECEGGEDTEESEDVSSWCDEPDSSTVIHELLLSKICPEIGSNFLTLTVDVVQPEDLNSHFQVECVGDVGSIGGGDCDEQRRDHCVSSLDDFDSSEGCPSLGFVFLGESELFVSGTGEINGEDVVGATLGAVLVEGCAHASVVAVVGFVHCVLLS
jgi:hypothetical protein